MDFISIFYFIKPFIPRRLQICIRTLVARFKYTLYKGVWPIDMEANKIPDSWAGWPEGKKFALVLTHDIENDKGLDRCYQLAELEKKLGFRSSFNFVAEGYNISPDMRLYLTNNGFEVGLHGVNHDPRVFSSKKLFLKQVDKINYYLKEWDAVGFRTPSMYHKLDWYHALNIEYDTSTFDTDPFEPQSDGVKTIFPFWVEDNHSNRGYVELPYTLPQDFTLFVLLKEKSNQIWKQKLDWIVKHGGMALMNTHPDYMCFDEKIKYRKEYPVAYYGEFLKFIRSQYGDQYWNPLPREVAQLLVNNKLKKEETLEPDKIIHFKYMGIKISNVRFEQIPAVIKKHIDNPGYICLTCVGNLIPATRDPELREAINGSILSIADGMPLAWFGWLAGYREVERISGMALMRRLLVESDFKHYLLGDTEERINKVIEKAKLENGKIRICGFSPPFKNVFNEEDNRLILNKINAQGPDIVWVAFGNPKQEKWMRQNIGGLKRGVMIGVGAAFKFYIGDLITPPKIIQRLGFQWFFRLIGDSDPIRVAKIQSRTMPIFMINFPYEVLRARKKRDA